MPNASVAAAASGLSKSAETLPAETREFDLHLHLCQLIGEVTVEEVELQKLFDAAQDDFARKRIERAMDDTYDRRNALMMALSAEQARSLSAAAAQMAAACGMFSTMTANQDPDLEAERAIERLIQSASLFLSPLARFSNMEATGVDNLFQPQLNRWRGIRERESVEATLTSHTSR